MYNMMNNKLWNYDPRKRI